VLTFFPNGSTSRFGVMVSLTSRIRARHSEDRLKQTGKTRKRGTKITFKPDPQIFDSIEFSFDKLSERLREKAFLNKGIRITIKDERKSRKVTRILLSWRYRGIRQASQ